MLRFVLILIFCCSVNAQSFIRNNLDTNAVGTAAADGWFLVSSNGIPLWSKNAGAATNTGGIGVIGAGINVGTTNGNVVTITGSNNVVAAGSISTVATNYVTGGVVYTISSPNPTNNDTVVSNGVVAIMDSGGPNLSIVPLTSTYFEDFLGLPNSSTIGSGVLGIRQTSTGLGAISPIEGETNAPGIIELLSGTGGAGMSVLMQAGSAIRGPFAQRGVMTNEVRFRVNTNITSTAGYQLLIGLGDDNISGGTYPTYGVFLQCDTNNANFQYVVSSNSGKHTNNTTLVPVKSTWYKFRSVMTRITGTTNVVFTIDGAQSITDTTVADIPQVSMQLMVMLKSGTVSPQAKADIDYEFVGYSLEATR